MGRTAKKTAAATETVGRSSNSTYGINFVDVTFEGALGMLNSFNLMREMREMWLTDETAGSMRWCISSTMAQVPWKHAPQVDGKTNTDDAEANKYALLADSLMDDMKDGMPAHVEDAMAMIWAGFAPCEIILKQRDGVKSRFNDKFYGVSKIPLRDPRTVTGWLVNEEEDISFMTQSGAKDKIPIWKLCHYRTTTEMDAPQGVPLLLAAYRSWKLKKQIQDSEAVGIERELVGLPVFRLPQEMYEQSQERGADGQPTDDAKRALSMIQSATEAVSKLRLNKSGGLVLFSNTYTEDGDGTDKTPKWDFKILTTGGQRTIDTRQPIRDYDRAIARVLMMQFLHLGDRSTGSYALSDDQSSMAYKSFMALALKVSREWSQKVLPLVWDVNGWPKKYLPLLEPGQINKQALKELGAFMTGLGKVAGLWEGDPKARRNISDTLGIETTPDTQRELADYAVDAAEAAANPPTVVNPNIGHNGGPALDPDADPAAED